MRKPESEKWKWSCSVMVDCSLPGSSVHGILQARVLEWVAISVSRGTSRPEDWTQVSRIAGTLPSEPPGKLFPEMEITQISWKLQNLCLPYFAFFCLPSGTFYLCFLFSTYFAKPTVTFSCSVDQCEWISGLGSQSFQSCLTLYSPMDCNPPGSSVHGIFPARILEWVAIPASMDLPDPGIEPTSPALQADFYLWATGKAQFHYGPL